MASIIRGNDGFDSAYYNEDGSIYIVTEELEKARADKDNQINEAKNYLASTDWIVTKIGDVQILGGDTTGLLEQYNLELSKRDECRALINSLETKDEGGN